MGFFNANYKNRNEVMDKIQIKEPKYIARRQDTPLGRIYIQVDTDTGELIEDKYSYSSTTILNVIDKGVGFLKYYSQGWEKAQQHSNYRAWIGTMTHDFIEKLLLGEKLNLGKPVSIYEEYANTDIKITESVPFEVDDRVRAFVDWWNTLKSPEIIAVELLLFHPQHYCAGTLDLLIRVDNKVMLVDFKTGKKYEKTQSIQLTYYKNLVEKIYKIKVDELACLFLTDKGKYKYEIMNYEPEIAEITYHLFRYKNSTFKTQKMPTIKLAEETSRIFKL